MTMRTAVVVIVDFAVVAIKMVVGRAAAVAVITLLSSRAFFTAATAIVLRI